MIRDLFAAALLVSSLALGTMTFRQRGTPLATGTIAKARRLSRLRTYRDLFIAIAVPVGLYLLVSR